MTKTLLVLIVFASVVFGQTWDGGSRIDTTKKQIHFFPAGEELYPKFITLQDLLDYEKECYADSSKIEKQRWVMYSKDELKRFHYFTVDTMYYIWNKDTTISLTPRYYYYTHREPTFRGFIEFMRGRNE